MRLWLLSVYIVCVCSMAQAAQGGLDEDEKPAGMWVKTEEEGSQPILFTEDEVNFCGLLRLFQESAWKKQENAPGKSEKNPFVLPGTKAALVAAHRIIGHIIAIEEKGGRRTVTQLASDLRQQLETLPSVEMLLDVWALLGYLQIPKMLLQGLQDIDRYFMYIFAKMPDLVSYLAQHIEEDISTHEAFKFMGQDLRQYLEKKVATWGPDALFDAAKVDRLTTNQLLALRSFKLWSGARQEQQADLVSILASLNKAIDGLGLILAAQWREGYAFGAAMEKDLKKKEEEIKAHRQRETARVRKEWEDEKRRLAGTLGRFVDPDKPAGPDLAAASSNTQDLALLHSHLLALAK